MARAGSIRRRILVPVRHQRRPETPKRTYRLLKAFSRPTHTHQGGHAESLKDPSWSMKEREEAKMQTSTDCPESQGRRFDSGNLAK